jgi:hypothetical protein
MPKDKPTSKTATPEVIIVQVQLEGEEAQRFEAYKKGQTLKVNAAAGRKLMLERLAQVEAEEAVA